MSVESWLARATVDVTTSTRSRRADLALALGVLVAMFAATLPLLRVVEPGWWVGGSVGLATLVVGAGFAARWFGLPGLAVALIELVTWVVAMTAAFGGSTSILWVVPTSSTIDLVPVLVSTAVDEITLGAAPLDAGFALSFLIVGSVGLLTLAIDHVVLTARMPLLAAVGLVAVSLVPSIAVPGEVDLAAFILLAAGILFLLRTDTRERQRSLDAGPAASSAHGVPDAEATDGGRSAGRSSRGEGGAFGGAAATALGIGAIAVVVAVVASPLLPDPVARAGSGGIGGGGARIDPTLELGDDLRQPREVDVLAVRSTASTPPYLRAVTLSRFDGAVWEPDDGDALPLDDAQALPAVEVDDDIPVTEHRTTIEILDLDSPWLPVPSPATGVTGLDGDWDALAANRTVVTGSGTTQGQTYEVTTSLPRPSLEQIRARDAAGATDDTRELPGDLPEVIGETALEVTAGADSDYDALLAMQAWFRGPDFEYSLEAPVAEGFDGTGADAVADFLAEREGYCVHYASAFALMARSLGMPARIVVGYLPGTSTSTQTQGQAVYTVSSGQLHAWPEVHFSGIGWVAFEPTNSLGVPTSFAPGAAGDGGGATDTSPQQPAQPSAAPSSSASAGAPALDDPGASGSGAGDAAQGVASPAVGVGLLALLAVLAPAVLREVRRRRSLADAAGGDPTAAWAAVQELAIDLGIAVPASESPRAFGIRLVAAHGAPREEMELLVRAIEQASYADDPNRRHTAFGEGEAWAISVTAVQRALREHAGLWSRATAVVAPRSLVVRPGSAYAAPRVTRAASVR